MADGIALWRTSRWPASRWRRAARMAIVKVVDVCATPDGLPADIVERVDAAYPFGERKYQPYKDWLLERKIFRGALAETPAVTADEITACEIARDAMAEIKAYRFLPTTSPLSPALGTVEQVVAMLDREAPNRLARKCPACAAKPGHTWFELEYDDPPIPGYGHEPTGRANLLVPHHARLVGHLDAGPLFTTRAT